MSDTSESITYLRERLDKAYKEGKNTEYMQHLSAVLIAAESVERTRLENESLRKRIYAEVRCNDAGLKELRIGAEGMLRVINQLISDGQK